MGMMDGRAVLVTGAGRGVGRGIALELAKAGAAVVVNDLGVSITGENAEGSPAEQVAAEIKALGGKAVANHDSVADWDGACAMVKSAVDNFGRIDYEKQHDFKTVYNVVPYDEKFILKGIFKL